MADDSDRIQEDFKFHPCDTPRGMTYYKLTELTEQQQTKLNGLKINIIRQNQIYLSEHPEVKVVISTILRAILRARPKVTLHEFLCKYFATAWTEIKTEIDKCIGGREKTPSIKHARSGSSIMKTLREIEVPEEEVSGFAAGQSGVTSDSYAVTETGARMCKSILNQIINEMTSDITLTTGHTPSVPSPPTYSDAKATPFNSEITLDTQTKDEIEEYLGE